MGVIYSVDSATYIVKWDCTETKLWGSTTREKPKRRHIALVGIGKVTIKQEGMFKKGNMGKIACNHREAVTIGWDYYPHKSNWHCKQKNKQKKERTLLQGTNAGGQMECVSRHKIGQTQQEEEKT